MLKSLKTYTIPIISLVLAIGLAFWRINYLERTNISLSIEIGSTAYTAILVQRTRRRGT